MGIHLSAGKGSGKSRLMGRIIAWIDFLRGVPQIIFDPVGGTIDNFLDKMRWFPREWRERLWPRIIYVDMSGRSGCVVPFPLYYRLGNESLSEIAGRYLQAVRRIDPFLVTASIEGWNALWRTGMYTGMVLAALGEQIVEAEDLLRLPEAWGWRMKEALDRSPELKPAVDFFMKEYAHPDSSPRTRARLAASFLNKIALFSLDPAMRAMFGAREPGIDWKEVERGRYTVLLDFRHEHDVERRRFKMYWVLSYLLEYIKHRGPGRHMPIALIIDELTALTNLEALGQSVFASDLDELINVLARNYMVWLTIAHQEMWQLDIRLQKTLMTMGTQILGVASDPDSREELGRHFSRYNPYLLKKIENVWMADTWGPYVVDHRTVEFTPEEQLLLTSQRFADLRRFEFLVRAAPQEGDLTGRLRRISLSNLDAGFYPHEALVTQARRGLVKNSGHPIEQLLEEVDGQREPRKALPTSLSDAEPGQIVNAGATPDIYG
jgi:hypothetical protein